MSMIDALRSAATGAKPAAAATKAKKGYGGIYGRKIARVASTVLGRNKSMALSEESQ